MNIVIVAPSLDIKINVSGISDVTNFIISHDETNNFIHFMQGKRDKEKGGIHRILRVIKNIKDWRNILNDPTITLVHYNFPLSFLSILRDFLFMRYAVKKNVPMVIHIHGGKYLFAKKRPWILKIFLDSIFKWECPFIVLSKLEKKILENNFNANKVHVLPNCIELSEQSNYNKDNYNQSCLHLLYMGRLDKEKGIDYILAAAIKMKQQGLDFTLHIAGQSQNNVDYVSAFQQHLGKIFVYEGVVSDNEKTNLLKKCHIFILPTSHEGMPISLLESMSFGLVPIVTNVGSISEMVVNRENGLYIEENSSDSIVNAVSMLTDNRSLLEKLGKSAWQTIENKLNPINYINSLHAIYNSTIS